MSKTNIYPILSAFFIISTIAIVILRIAPWECCSCPASGYAFGSILWTLYTNQLSLFSMCLCEMVLGCTVVHYVIPVETIVLAVVFGGLFLASRFTKFSLKKPLAVIGVVLLIVSIAVTLIIFFAYKTEPKTIQISKSTNQQKIGDVVEFSGVMTKFDDRCEVDIRCIAYVDGKSIITNPGDIGGTPIKLGKSTVWNEDIGKIVEVRAIKISETEYTLVGDESLYIRVQP